MPYETKDLSIAVGSSETSAITLNELSLVGFVVSASSMTATTLTLQVSTNGTNYYPLYGDDSNEVSFTVTTAVRAYNVDPTKLYPWNFVKFREGTSASAVNQVTVPATITAVIRNV